jgi:23S rRNA (cytidine1920-2'-O)/16S rRNA (cytidine1409-2'-O)-methyltransferase
MPYVSRGGVKLARALEHWHIDVAGAVCVDVGASTGGFTDCLLQAGAAQVIAIDTGYGQMDARLRNDPRLRLLEKTNARYLTPEQLWGAESPLPIALVAVDVSFISATLVLPAVVRTVGQSSPPWQLVVLVKPQFEAGREQVGKGGIVRDAGVQLLTLGKVAAAVYELGGVSVEAIESPITGAEGNREFLLHAIFS